jgi:hypothetical protein
MEINAKVPGAPYHVPRRFGLKKRNPSECKNAAPYMVDNGVLDMYICKKFNGNCYFEPNGGKQFVKMCEGGE